jgi:hypothetical protein
MLIKLSTDLILNIFVMWIELSAIGCFDSAYCNVIGRSFLLLAYQIPCFGCSGNTVLPWLSAAFMSWLSSRNIKLFSIQFRDMCFTDQQIQHHFNVCNTTEITFYAVNSNIDLVSVLNQTKMLTCLNVELSSCFSVSSCALVSVTVLQKLRTFTLCMNESSTQKWVTIFNLVLCYCSNVVDLKLSGHGLKRVEDAQLIRLMRQITKLERLLLSCPISGEVLRNIAEKTPTLKTLLCYHKPNTYTTDSWAGVAHLFQQPIVSETIVLSPLCYLTDKNALLVNFCTQYTRVPAQVPYSFYTNSLNLLSITFGKQCVFSTTILTNLSSSNPFLRSISFKCECMLLSYDVLSIFLCDMKFLEVLIVNSLSHLTSDDIFTLFCNPNISRLVEIHVTFCAPMLFSQLIEIMNCNPQLKTLRLSSHYLHKE